MKVYKAVRIDKESKLKSLFLSVCQLEYKVGEWTKPTVGKIFAFETLEACWSYMFGRTMKYAIFEAEADFGEPAHRALFLDLPELMYNDIVSDFWQNRVEFARVCGLRTDLISCPGGTVLCNNLKLIKEVRNYAL